MDEMKARELLDPPAEIRGGPLNSSPTIQEGSQLGRRWQAEGVDFHQTYTLLLSTVRLRLTACL